MEAAKFQHKLETAKGEPRAFVKLNELRTLWFNTGTLCNLECANCYIESSPKNDLLSFISTDDVRPYLEEIKAENHPVDIIGLTGGEPFLNPHIIGILEAVLAAGFELLVLTNANRVLKRHKDKLMQLKENFGQKLHFRVSLDHFTEKVHDQQRGLGAFNQTIKEIKWLYDQGFNLSIASRSLLDESHESSLEGHKLALLAYGIDLDLKNKLVVFPEMHEQKDVPEITTSCWDILNKKPDQQMCASERMIVKRKGEDKAIVMPCTLLAYDEQFILGNTLAESSQDVYLNHKFCAQFCVLGGASCSSAL